MGLLFRLVEHGSPEYYSTVVLRDCLLRKPLNMAFAEEELAREDSSFHLACYLEDKLVACLILRPAGEASLQMRQVAVACLAQGKGIGRALVLYAEEFARQKGCQQIVLHSRLSAVPFYLKLNYSASGDIYEEVGLPHITMLKELDI
jgi:predicted GNAT family N-acyltransferase